MGRFPKDQSTTHPHHKRTRRTAVISPQHKPAEQIGVQAFRQILWLPLRCKPGFDAALGQSHWQEAKGERLDLWRDANLASEWDPQEANSEHYASYLYFHPFIRRFLFDQPANAGPALQIWQLTAARKSAFEMLDVALPQGQNSDPSRRYVLRFRVVRCLLHHFKLGGVAMLEIELECVEAQHRSFRAPCGSQLSLAEVLDALDFVRRTHPPFFPAPFGNASVLHETGGRFPLAAEFHPASMTFDVQADLSEKAAARKIEFLNAVIKRRPDADSTPMAQHWAALLGESVSGQSTQIEDERMPYMAYVAVPEPHQIGRGDWMRLAFADYRGGDTLPYATDFTKSFEEAYCYDRYFEVGSGWKNTRYLNVGYAFAMVGSSSSDFFFKDGLTHFRRQYACIGLLSQFNKAALLTFSHELSEASELRTQDPKAYADKLRDILGRFTEFTHRYWFDGVSNQLQANELQQYWHKHLRLAELYAAVSAEVQTAYAYVNAEEERAQSKTLKQLSEGALYVAMAGLFLAALGAGFPFDKPLSLFETTPACFLLAANCQFDIARTLFISFTFLIFLVLGPWLRQLLLHPQSSKRKSKQ
jgi:hypothetical protein